MADALIRLPAVKSRTGLSRSTIYLKMSRSEFPSPVPLGARAVGWLEEEISAWISGRIAEREESQKKPKRQRRQPEQAAI